MDSKRFIQSHCERCGKTLCTPAIPGFADRPMYRKYGRLCTACLTEEEKKSLSDEHLMDTLRGTRRYRISGRIDWGSDHLDDNDRQILRYIASRIFYAGGRPSLRSIMAQFPGIDVEERLSVLEEMGLLQSYHA